MIERQSIPDVLLISPTRHSDDRGWFSETFRRDFADAAGLPAFVQENESLSRHVNVLRGLHFQIPPFAQAKLVRCVQGAIIDVAVDIRKGSATFGHHVAVELSAENGGQLFVPVGFAHGYCTTHPVTLIQYKVSSYYSPEHERGLAWDDPALGISWPVDVAVAVTAERDRAFPRLSELSVYFT